MSYTIFYKINHECNTDIPDEPFYFIYDGNLNDGRRVWKFGEKYFLDFTIYEANFFIDKLPDYFNTTNDSITHYLFEVTLPITLYRLEYSFPEGYMIPQHMYKFYQKFPYVTLNIKEDKEICIDDEIAIDNQTTVDDDFDSKFNITKVKSFFNTWKHKTQTSKFKKIYTNCVFQTSRIFKFMKKTYNTIQKQRTQYCSIFLKQIKSDIRIKKKREKAKHKQQLKQLHQEKLKQLQLFKEKIEKFRQQSILKKIIRQWKYFVSKSNFEKKIKSIQNNVIESWIKFINKRKDNRTKITKKYFKIWVDITFLEKRLLEKKQKKKEKKKNKNKLKKQQKKKIRIHDELNEKQFNQNLLIDHNLKENTIYKIPLLSENKEKWLHIMKKNMKNSKNTECIKNKLSCLKRKQITDLNKITDDDLKIVFLNIVPYLKPNIMSKLSKVSKQWNKIWKNIINIPRVIEYYTSVFIIVDISLRNYIIKSYTDHKVIMTNYVKNKKQIMIKKQNSKEVLMFDDKHVNMLTFKKNILSLKNRDNINIIDCIKKSIQLFSSCNIQMNLQKYKDDYIDDFFPECTSPIQILILCITAIKIEMDCIRDVYGNHIFPFENIGMVIDNNIIRNPILSRPIPNALYLEVESLQVIKYACQIIKLYVIEHRSVRFLAQGNWSEYNELIEIAIKLESNAVQIAEYCEEWLNVYAIYFTLTDSWNQLYKKNICVVCGEIIENDLYITKSCKRSKPHCYHLNCVMNDHTINSKCLGCLLQTNYDEKSNKILEYFKTPDIPYEAITHNIVTKTVNCPLNYKINNSTEMFLSLMTKHKNYDKLCYDNCFLKITKLFMNISPSILKNNKELIELTNAYNIITKKYGNHNDTHTYILNDKCVYKKIIGLQISLVATKEDIDKNNTLVNTIFDNMSIYKTVYSRMLQHILKSKSKKENNHGIIWCVKNNDGYVFFVYSSWITIIRKNI